jgi:ketosteroid isomerase-like protein
VTASENLDLVRSIYAAWERGDYSTTDWAHPEIEWVIADGPDPGRWTGIAGMPEGFRGWLGAWEDLRFVPDEYRELDDGRILVLHHIRRRGRRSGVELREIMQAGEGAAVFHIDGGKVTRYVTWATRERAFTDLGIASEGGLPS